MAHKIPLYAVSAVSRPPSIRRFPMQEQIDAYNKKLNVNEEYGVDFDTMFHEELNKSNEEG